MVEWISGLPVWLVGTVVIAVEVLVLKVASARRIGLPLFAVVLAAMVSVTLGVLGVWLPEVKLNAASKDMVAVVARLPVAGAIFRFHPGAEDTFRSQVGIILRSAPEGEFAERVLAASATMQQTYFDQDLLKAGDEDVFGLVRRGALSLATLKHRTDLCLAYLEEGRATAGEPAGLSQKALEEEAEMRIAIVRKSALLAMPEDHQFLDPRALVREISLAYRSEGRDPARFKSVAGDAEVEPEERCRAMTEFLGLLAGLEPAQASRIYKGFVRLGAR